MYIMQDDINDKKRLEVSGNSTIIVTEKELQKKNVTENRVEILTKAGIKVLITYTRSSEMEKLLISSTNKRIKQDKIIELDLERNAISISTDNDDLKIRARNIEIEATDTIKIKSKSTMTINGSTINLN